MILRSIALDDEPVALDIIRRLCQGQPAIHLDGTFTNPHEAAAQISKGETDLVFLDIRMPDISGIEFMEQVEPRPLVIFTTAYSEHAVKSFELNAVDYLLKPFSPERFAQACAKAVEVFEFRTRRQAIDHLFVRSGYEQVKVPFNDLLYVQSAGNYVQFILRDRKVLARMTMAEAEAQLPAADFSRIHRSYIVGRRQVSATDRNTVTIGNERLPVGGGYDFRI